MVEISAIYCIVFRPLATSSVILPIYPENSIFKGHLVDVMYSYQLLIVIYFQQLRLWFIYYDLRKNEHLIALKYIKQYKFREYKNHRPWTLRYNKTLGNTNFMIVITLIICLCLVTFIVMISNHELFRIFDLVVPALTLVWMIPLSIVAARLKDEIGIGREIRAICVCVVIFISIFSIGSILLPNDTRQKPRDCFMFILWGPLVGLTGILRSIHVPSLKLKNGNCLNEITHVFALNCNTNTHESKQIDYVVNNKNVVLNDILKHRDGVDAFVNHCIKEFSVENILYLMEVYDVKTILTDNNILELHNIDTNHPIWEMIINKPFAIKPDKKKTSRLSIKRITSQSSSADTNMNEILNDCIDHLIYLFNEYIDTSSVSIINISAPQRKKVLECNTKLHDNIVMNSVELKTQAIIEVFLEHISCGKSIYNLLRNDTWMRFKSTNQFEILCESIVDNE